MGKFMHFMRPISDFAKCTQGNAAIILALTFMVIIGLVGAAIDFNIQFKTKTYVQDSLDEAVLAAGANSTYDATTLQNSVVTEFNREMADRNYIGFTVTSFTYNTTTRVITATAHGDYTPLFLGFFGITHIPFTVTSQVTRTADGMVELALVLDNTWSMSEALDGTQTKIQVLKTAASSLVGELMTPSNKPYVKVAVVPYADYVNVGLANRNASWLSVPNDSSTTSSQTCNYYNTKTVCSGGTIGTCTGSQDGVPYTYSCWVVPQTCQVVSVPTYQSCSGGTTTTYKWYGCVKNIVQSGTLSMPDPTTAYPGISQTSQTCLNPIQPLTNDPSVVSSAISGLVVNIGSYKPETYIPSGLIWGVNVLSPPAPFSEGAPYDSKNKMPRKTIVLMTDGANTLYVNSSGGTAKANASQLLTTYSDQARVCSYAKSKGIEIYTIGFGVTDPTSLSALKSCASDSSHYFDAQSSADLLSAFKIIAGNLSKLRLSQ